mmetsp:Transcript_50999/g.155105  ORF Transcript_50999/g.155105 Transcript_50999/m.155105 type:complete len:183 (-) Transcript_50999:62-610(-)
MSLRLTCARLAARRSAPALFSGPTHFVGNKPSKPRLAFGYGEVAPPNAPGFDTSQLKPPETVADTVKYITKGTFKGPLKKEIIEAIGYPGQRHSAGGITTVGRIFYGPGRYDYGRPVMPKGWFANWFYGFWEFGHLMFVADRWIWFRQLRHLIGTAVCFFPMWLQMQWNVKAWEDFKATHTQ